MFRFAVLAARALYRAALTAALAPLSPAPLSPALLSSASPSVGLLALAGARG